MSRIRKFYETRFRALAAKFTSPEDFVTSHFDQAKELSRIHELKDAFALAIVHADLRRASGETTHFPKKFFCDAGLGGLARWLCGAGYEASWKPELDDAAAIRETEKTSATLITTDTLMMERGVLRDGHVPALCIPSSLTCEEQLIVVFRELGLSILGARCMHCGGELRPVSKTSVADRIPPRTALWLDEYFLCTECDQLFWRGTHWKKIFQELQNIEQALPVIEREKLSQNAIRPRPE